MLSVYAKRLAQENVNDVSVALKAMEEKPRQEGESVMPSIGTILAAVETEKRIRLARESAAGQECLVRWKCPICKVTCSGWLKPGQSRQRYCHGVPRKETYAYGEICGGTLELIDEFSPEQPKTKGLMVV